MDRTPYNGRGSHTYHVKLAMCTSQFRPNEESLGTNRLGGSHLTSGLEVPNSWSRFLERKIALSNKNKNCVCFLILSHNKEFHDRYYTCSWRENFFAILRNQELIREWEHFKLCLVCLFYCRDSCGTCMHSGVALSPFEFLPIYLMYPLDSCYIVTLLPTFCT